MLSRKDIEKQIGKGISIVPFKRENIKENTINLTLSHISWTIRFDEEEKMFQSTENIAENNYIKLAPHSTCIVYTEEVISLNGYYGGTFHAKVGVAAKGVIFSSTTIGPWYHGHLMISLQNPTDFDINLKIGDTFISMALYKLDTPIKKMIENSNTGGHVEKLSYYGVQLNDELQRYFDENWKKTHASIIEKLQQDEEYKDLKSYLKKQNKIKNKALGICLIVLSCVIYMAFSKIKGLASIQSLISTAVSDAVLYLIVAIINKYTGFIDSLINKDE